MLLTVQWICDVKGATFFVLENIGQMFITSSILFYLRSNKSLQIFFNIFFFFFGGGGGGFCPAHHHMCYFILAQVKLLMEIENI
ncbi:hypothetical protein ACJX0J_017012, partial [Zea mays]